MKKIICWLLTLAICTGLAACGTPAPVETSAPPTTVPSTLAPTPTTSAPTKPAETQPVETEPAVTEPVVTEPVETEPALTDVGAILDAAYALADGESMAEAVTLTGTVFSVDTPWSEQYQNITVTIKVPGYEDKPIMCYRLAGEGAKDLKYGDTITVAGTIKNYKGTIEFAQGCGVSEIVKGDGAAPEAPDDILQVIEEAKALKPGQSLPYPVLLTGRINSIKYGYSPNFDTVDIMIGTKNTHFHCYKLRYQNVEWVKEMGVKDWVTVYGTLKNYNGTLEFDNAVMVNYHDLYTPVGPEDPLAHIDEAYELKDGKSLEYESTLTGKITSVDTAWSDQYGNITVTMEVAGREGKPIQCFRLSGEGAKDLAVNDTITVTGKLKNYKGTIEFDSGCELLAVEKAPVAAPEDPAPSEPENTDPTPDSTLSLTEAAALGASKEHNTYTEGKYYVSGIVKEVTSTKYGNMVIEDAEGNALTIYGTYSADGADRYDAMQTKPVAGDAVKIYGIIGQYNDKAQMKNGWIVEHTPAVTPETPETPEAPETPETPETPGTPEVSVPASLTYNFANVSGSGAYLDDNALAIFQAAENDSTLVSVAATTVTEGNNSTSGAYPAQGGFLKTGTSKKAGKLVLTFAENAKVTKVKIKCHDWYTWSEEYPTNSNKVAVNGSATQLAPYTADATAGVLTFELDGSTNVVTIDAANRVFIFEIVVYFAQ